MKTFEFFKSFYGVGFRMMRLTVLRGFSFLTIFPILLSVYSFADINSTSGKIEFDVNSDGTKEMMLNSIGLGIGVEPSANIHVQGNVLISQSLVVGETGSSSNLHIMGSLAIAPNIITSHSSLGESSVVLANSSSDNLILTLPYAGNVIGRVISIKKISPLNTVWIGGGGNLIDDAAHIEMSPSANLQSLSLLSNSGQWFILNQQNSSTRTVAAVNLIGWWKMNEASGGNTVMDYSGYGNHGVANESIVSTSGNVQSAIDFSSSTQRIEIPNESHFDLTDQLSISCWFKVDTGGWGSSWASLVSKRRADSPASDKGWALRRNASTSFLYGYFQGLNDSNVIGDTNVHDGAYHHVAMTYDGTTISLYIDGILDQADAATGVLLNNDLPVVIGAKDNSGSSRFNGIMDDVRIYNRSLTLTEVQSFFQMGQ
jgi:hypothetical protein